MRIVGVGSAFPRHYHKQEVLVQSLKHFWRERLPKPEALERLSERMTVDGRYLARPLDFYENLQTWGEANNTWIEVGLELGEQALCRALVSAGLRPRDLGAIIVTSVTGIAAPSLDARLINRMGLSVNIRRTPIFGLGCVAGAAGISRAADFVRGYPGQAAALLSVELCSLTIQRDDVSKAQLISSLLFGDGAAATIVAGSNLELNGPEIIATKSVFYPHSEHVMGWNVSEKGFHIVLSPDVPKVVLRHMGQDVDEFLGEQGLTRSSIGSWIMHTGGPKVLKATATALGINETELQASWDCLRKVGNISSTSVLLVLEDVFRNRRPAPGTWSVLAAMGPGFCAELILLRW